MAKNLRVDPSRTSDRDTSDSLWDHYESTGDVVRLISKFGNFTFEPAFISYSTGNNIGGACNFGAPGTAGFSTCTPQLGSGGMNDYSLILKYENTDDDLEGGVNFIRRVAGFAQDPFSGYSGVGGGTYFNTWDIYARRGLGQFAVAAEVPITSGILANSTYSAFALAGELNWRPSDTWEIQAKGGHAPGEPSGTTSTPGSFNAFFFNPNYTLGTVMFNYALHHFAGPNTSNNPNGSANSLVSPYDNPIVDANYIGLSGLAHTDKWTFNLGFVWAHAPETCTGGAGNFCYNNWTRQEISTASGTDAAGNGKQQGGDLGWELDGGASFQYDEYFVFKLDLGVFMPGSFYAYSNAITDNATNAVFAAVGRIGVNF